MWRSESARFVLPDAARLFPELAPYEPPGKTEEGQKAHLLELAASFVETEIERDDESLDHPTLPAAYAPLAQLVEHDLSFESLACSGTAQRRAPRLDLATVYGSGPEQAYLYDRADPARLLLQAPHGPGGGLDLPRNQQGAALIGDPRNDQNLITGQLHQALLRFHNEVLEWVRDHWGSRPRDTQMQFEAAQRLARWHFQWVVVHDFLPRLVGRALVEELLPRPGEPANARTSIYGGVRETLPVEFLAGAYAALSSLGRSRYDLNDDVRDRAVHTERGTSSPEPADLCGGRFLPVGWTVQWDRFLEIDGSEPQRSRRLDTHLGAWAYARPPEERCSPVQLALESAWLCGVPSGQSVARALGLRPVREGHDPLLAYVLTEAEDPPSDGQRLVGVGARIVAEVVIGAVANDPGSFLRLDRAWRPELVPAGRTFDLAELLRFARMPLARADLPTLHRGSVPARRAEALRAAEPAEVQETRL